MVSVDVKPQVHLLYMNSLLPFIICGALKGIYIL